MLSRGAAFQRELIVVSSVVGERRLVHRVPLPRGGIVAFVLSQHGPEDACMLVSDGDQRLVVALTPVELNDPAL